MADQAVPLARHARLNLAGRCEFEALLGARLRLQFGHFHSLFEWVAGFFGPLEPSDWKP
jgi:hypothetical protein